MIAPLRQLSGWLVLVCCCPWAWAGHASHRLERLANLDASRTPLSKDQNLDQLIQMGLPQSGPGSLVQDEDGQLLAYVHLHPDLAPDTTASSLTRFGIKVVHIAPQYGVMTVRGRPSALLRLSQMAQVSYVEEALAPATSLHWQKGLAEETHKLPDLTLRNPLEGRLPPSCNQVVSEGDIVLGAAQARQQFAVSGKGVRIGILSDSFDVAPGLGHGAPHDIWFGELPGFNPFCGIHPPVEVIADAKPRQGADEGRAMAQIIHDLAPGARQYFATAFDGLFAFADNIRALREAGADIITDDVFYFAEPFYQDGPVAQAINEVVTDGALYTTAAGNGNLPLNAIPVGSYEAPAYRPVPCLGQPPGYGSLDCHSFNPNGTDPGFGMTLAKGGTIQVLLQWTEPWFGVRDDFDLILSRVEQDGSRFPVAMADGDSLGSQQPWEALFYSSTTGGHYELSINRHAGSGMPRLKMVFLQSTFGVDQFEYATPQAPDQIGPTIYGHASAPAVMAVAAVPYDDPGRLETYSSIGPAHHYFAAVANASPAASYAEPQLIEKPDIAATDGGATSFFGYNRDGIFRFYGTSAAAPHAAAILALLKEKYPALHQDEARSLLEASARPIGPGAGAGVIDAVAAFEAAASLKGQGLRSIPSAP